MTRTSNKLKVINSFNPRVQYEWRAKSRYGDDMRIIGTESPPAVRSILIGRRIYRLAFPWIYYFLIFSGNRFHTISLFYGKRSITINSRLYLPCLSNIHDNWICGACFDTVEVYGPRDWHKVIEEFWAGKFNWSDSAMLVEKYGTRDKYHLTLADWQAMSASDPEKIYNFPWLPAEFENGGSSIGDYLESVADYFGTAREAIEPATRQRKRSE